MAKVTLMADGAKYAKASGRNSNPPTRGNITGWGRASARRNIEFLMSVDGYALDGFAVAFTLTIRDIPETHAEWERIRRAFVSRLERMGMIRLHWLTEFQRRGAPHLHGIGYFPDTGPSHVLPSLVRSHWLDVTAHLAAAERGQHVAAVTNLTGWKQYLGKHGSRSVQHYQRSVIPPGWRKTGRMWGKRGGWPVLTLELELDDDAFFAFRRFARSYMLSEARTELRTAGSDQRRRRAALRRIAYLRGRLKANKRTIGEIKCGTDWIPPHVVQDWLQATQDGKFRLWADRPGEEVERPPSLSQQAVLALV